MMVRSLVSLLLLTGCATASAPISPEAARGCWIERRGDETLTMRWFPDRRQTGAWHGDLMRYTPNEEPLHQGFRLEPAGAGWRMCPLDDGMPHGPPCRDGFIGAGVETEENGGEWLALVPTPTRLRLEHWVSGMETVFFDGARDGCD